MKFSQKQPCKECPFRRQSLPGFLGEFAPLEFLQQAHGEAGLPCHLSIARQPNLPGSTELKDATNAQQCVGAILHANRSAKRYQNPDLAAMQDRLRQQPSDVEILGIKEFLEHHQ